MRLSPFFQLALGGLLFVMASSCVPFRDSPFSDTLLRDESDLNSVNMNKVGGLEEDQVLRIAVMGDSHGNYKDLDRTIAAINEVHDVDFTVHLGDLTNSSYNFEYDQFLSSYAKLHTTKFMVIGNPPAAHLQGDPDGLRSNSPMEQRR